MTTSTNPDRGSRIPSRPLVGILAVMKRIRSVEETIAGRYREGKMRCPVHLCTGQEAIAAAVCAQLRKDDQAVSHHRCHGHYLAKGGDLRRMIAEIYGKATGCSGGRGGSMHLVDREAGFAGSTSIVGGIIPVGTGLGLALALEGKGRVSTVFFGDGAAEEGVFFESISFAALKRLPVLYVCENNGYSVNTSLAWRQPPGRSIVAMVRGLGVAGDNGDGNDAVDVSLKTRRALRHVRSGKGPFFLEFSTYRWREHCGPAFDYQTGCRPAKELAKWMEQDPIARLEKRLRREKLITEKWINRRQKLIDEELEEAFRFAEDSPFPAPAEAFTRLFRNEGAP